MPIPRLRLITGRRNSQHGFSLIELLIALVIIGILVGLAVPIFMSTTVKAKQAEAQGLLNQIYLLERSYFEIHDQYWVPGAGITASKNSPFAFDTLGVEIMKSARYAYVITGDVDHFTAVATATRLDDDPAIDQWQVDETGAIRVISDDAIAR